MPVLLLLAIVLGVVTGLLRGGSLGALGRVRVFRPWLLVAAIAALVIGRVVDGTFAAGWVAATVLLALFAATNTRLPGLGLVLVGVALNTAVIVANGGQMPVSMSAADRAGVSAHSVVTSPRLEPADAGTVLRPVGDVIPLAVPHVQRVISGGDVLVAAGIGLFGALAPVRARRTLDARRTSRAKARFRTTNRSELGPVTGDA
ncbi:MAG: DUF5317 domain-containing protein [Frankia sp.]